MRFGPLFGFVVALPGCALFNIGTGDSASAAAGGATDTDAGAVVSGVNCGADPNTGVTLCLGISSCPTVAVDTDALPGCGFRISGSTIDLECMCGGDMCPVGAAATCDAAAALIAQQNTGVVCAQISAGTCVQVPVVATTSASSSGGGTCDTTCRDECGGDPGCIGLCGC